MKKNLAVLFALIMILAVGVSFAEEAKKAPSPFKLIIQERFRIETYDNAISLDEGATDSNSYTRNKTVLGFLWNPSSKWEVGFKFANENRTYLAPKSKQASWNEVFVDTLYVKWKNVADLPLTLTLGRQEWPMQFGDGFIIMDGTPLDGSRSFYFNAIRADYAFNKNHQLTAFVTYVNDHDNLMFRINEQTPAQGLVEQPEVGYGLYYKGKFKDLNLDLYAIRKDTDSTSKYPIESGINTFGARIKYPLVKDLAVVAEGALQSGSYGDEDRSAFGGNFHFDYNVNKKVPFVKGLSVGGIYLSGDDQGTAKMEGWDPVFSRWPKWSESYIYTFVKEKAVAYWSNFTALYVSLQLDFDPSVSGQVSYYHMGSDEKNGNPFPGGTGKTRGDLVTSKLSYKINKYLTGHAIWENFQPGNFYKTTAAGHNWLRFELMFQY